MQKLREAARKVGQCRTWTSKNVGPRWGPQREIDSIKATAKQSPPDTVDELTAAGRATSTDQLGNDEVDWIEAAANDEEPGEWQNPSGPRTVG